MKTAGKENPNRCAITRQPTELLGRKLELSRLNQAGWKARKHPATAKYFFLTFPFIELIGNWQACCTRTMIVDVDTAKKPGNARRLREIIASVSDSMVLLLG